MSEQTEWEVIDTPAPETKRGGTRWSASMLGRHSKLKLAGIAIVGVALLVFVLMLAGIVVVLLTGVALLSLGVAKLRRFLRKDTLRETGYKENGQAGDWNVLR
jgi:4-hydroxybenzoate polyprenyltransferase